MRKVRSGNVDWNSRKFRMVRRPSLDQVANQIIKEFGINFKHLHLLSWKNPRSGRENKPSAANLWRNMDFRIIEACEQMSPELLGVIAWQGKSGLLAADIGGTPLCQVAGHSAIPSFSDSGMEILLRLAAWTITARIYDILLVRHEAAE